MWLRGYFHPSMQQSGTEAEYLICNSTGCNKQSFICFNILNFFHQDIERNCIISLHQYMQSRAYHCANQLFSLMFYFLNLFSLKSKGNWQKETSFDCLVKVGENHIVCDGSLKSSETVNEKVHVMVDLDLFVSTKSEDRYDKIEPVASGSYWTLRNYELIIIALCALHAMFVQFVNNCFIQQ